jgi:SPP1 gp7 family putative phage head morphogenesis protein
MGITENVNRANAEAGDYTYARWIVTPRLKRLQGKLNEQYLPLFPNSQNLILIPENVIPQSKEENRMLAESGVKTGYMTINEAREIQGLDPVIESTGDVLMTPLGAYPMSINEETPSPQTIQPTEQPDANPDTVGGIVAANTLNGIQIQSALQVLRDLMANNIPDTVALELLVAVGIDRERAQQMISACSGFTPENPGYDPAQPSTPPESPPVEPAKTVKKKRELPPEWKEAYWKGYVTRAEAYEKKMILGLKDMFDKQESVAVGKLEVGSHDLLDKVEAKVEYSKVATPILTDLLKLSIKNGAELINPKPHKAPPPEEPLSEAARKWLLTRIAWAAEQIGDETATLLSLTLAAGYDAGESIPDIAERVQRVFEDCSKRRSILIARTETISASAQGAIEGYKEAEISQAEFLAALDDRTCEDCNSMDGEVFDLEDTTGVIPIHPDCRCCWLPVV